MSANNQVVIVKGRAIITFEDKLKARTEDTYIIQELDIDTQSGHLIGTRKTLKEAIKMANKYLENNEVEYGLDIRI